jgi:beta-lactamase regulating signal transducer with metallopeptidase domain
MGLVIAAIVGALFLGSISIHAALHHQVARSLDRWARPAIVADHAVGLVPGIGAALVAGIRRPRIYCSDNLATRLTPSELHAVLLHERHHELSHAPAMLVVLSALTPFIGHTGLGSGWLERRRAAIEIAADEHAIRNGATRSTLARAIVKLRETPAQLPLAGFATASDLRLRALLGENVERDAPIRGARVVVAVGVAVAVAALCSMLSAV